MTDRIFAELGDTPLPNPGSDAAIGRGCLCSAKDNANGRGFHWGGEVCFWLTDGCPIHAPKGGDEPKSPAQ